MSISTPSTIHGPQNSFAREEVCFQRRNIANLQMIETENQSFVIGSDDSIEDRNGKAHDCEIEDLEMCSLQESQSDISPVSENIVEIAIDLDYAVDSEQMRSSID